MREASLSVVALVAIAPLVAEMATAQAPVPVTTDLGAATVYPAYPVLTAELQDLAARYKDIARLHSAGQSTKGMDLWYMELADFENPGRVPLEAREVLYIDGGTHANEYIGVIFVMHVLRSLLSGYGTDETMTWIVENRHTLILPLVNPEGSMNGVGRLNDNLVNINRNYPVGWADVDETPIVNNPGPYPASEPETRAVMGIWERHDPDYIVSIHCCGNLWLYPYGIEGREPHPDDKQVFERICDEVLFDVRDSCGPIWSTIYPASGSTTDSGYELHGANAWGIEMSGRESEPFIWGPPAYTTAIEELEKESWRAVMHAFLNVERYGALPKAALEAVDSSGAVFRITNEGWGKLSRAVVRAVDGEGLVREAAVPSLPAGESAAVRIPGAFGPGTFPVTIEYAKRPLDSKLGALHLALGVASSASGLAGSLAESVSDVPLVLTQAPADGDEARAVPGLGLAAIAAVFALAGVARCRRGPR